MKEEAKKTSRRDMLQIGAALAGAAAIQPLYVGLVGKKTENTAAVSSANGASSRAAGSAAESPFPKTLKRGQTRQPNVLLIVLDTVRADRMSCYGYFRETTPNIDAFAAGARLYQNAVSPGCFTLPSHASMFTGMAVSAHGAVWLHQYLDDRFETLAGRLAKQGYQTVGLASNNALVTPTVGLARGFQQFWNGSGAFACLVPETDAESMASQMHRELGRWFAADYDPDKPFFCFLNYIEAHQPYLPPPANLHFASQQVWNRWKAMGDRMNREMAYMLAGADTISSEDIADSNTLYDDSIRYNDSKVGELLAFLKATGLEENTVVLLTADHGEHLGEHRLLTHVYSAYEPVVHVPLIVRGPQQFAAGVEQAPVQSHDVYPTILELAGIEWKPSPGLNSRSLLQPPTPARACISEYLDPWVSSLQDIAIRYRWANCSIFNRRLRAIRVENMKLISPSKGKVELYDLADDPLETKDLAQKKPEVVQQLSGRLDEWLQSFEHYVTANKPSGKPVEVVSPEKIKAMRGLGYIQ